MQTAPEDSPGMRSRWLERWWSCSAILLVACTWRLWLPSRDVPHLPAFDWLVPAYPALDYVGLPLLAIGLVWSVARGRVSPLASIGLVLLLAIDQLRWQPWVVHLLMVAPLVSRPSSRSLCLMRALAVAIYFWAGIAKLDAEFAATLGQQLLEVLAGWSGVSLERWPASVRFGIALAMPLGELAAAVSLAIPRTRTVGLVLATTMHGGNLLLLGPLGLNHWPGVLAWNLVFALHAWLLFAPSRWLPTRKMNCQGVDSPRAIACWPALVGIIAPVLGPVGVADAWPAWALYAPGYARAEVYAAHDVLRKLPLSMRSTRGSDDPWGGSTQPIRIGGWVLAALGAPLYPSQRTTVAVTQWIGDQCATDTGLRVELLDPGFQLPGQPTELADRAAREAYLVDRWLGTRCVGGHLLAVPVR